MDHPTVISVILKESSRTIIATWETIRPLFPDPVFSELIEKRFFDMEPETISRQNTLPDSVLLEACL